MTDIWANNEPLRNDLTNSILKLNNEIVALEDFYDAIGASQDGDFTSISNALDVVRRNWLSYMAYIDQIKRAYSQIEPMFITDSLVKEMQRSENNFMDKIQKHLDNKED